MVFQNNVLAGGAGGSGTTTHTIDQSIRFNSGDTAYMTRTPSSAGNTKTFTYSVWFKLGDMASTQRMLLSVRNSDTSRDNLIFNQGSSGDFRIYLDARVSGSAHTVIELERAFRDPSAWYHFVMSIDTTNAIETERVRFYLNGERQTSFQGTPNYPGLNQTFYINSTNTHSIGRFEFSSPSGYWDGYMAEIVLLDGTSTDCTSFGEFNSSGIWIPKDVSSLSFGTNGFHIDGRDSADLGDDESGNGNDFTTSGLASHDQVADSPTNNFCVMNPLNTHSSITLSNGNLQSTASAFTGSGASILLPSTGKWYAEMRYNNASAGEYPMIGIYNTIKNLSTSGLNPGNTSGDKDIGFGADGRRRENATNTTSWGNAVSDGKIGALAIDMDNKKIWFGHNNSGSFVWQASGNPSAGSNEANTIAFADDVIFGNSHYSSSIVCWNFGQDGTFGGTETAQGNSDANGVGNFYYAPPTNYLALCTKNLGS